MLKIGCIYYDSTPRRLLIHSILYTLKNRIYHFLLEKFCKLIYKTKDHLIFTKSLFLFINILNLILFSGLNTVPLGFEFPSLIKLCRCFVQITLGKRIFSCINPYILLFCIIDFDFLLCWCINLLKLFLFHILLLFLTEFENIELCLLIL